MKKGASKKQVVVNSCPSPTYDAHEEQALNIATQQAYELFERSH
jgi:ferredoxin-like protein FixX